MTLVIPDDALLARRSVAAGPLAALAQSLAQDLEPLIARGPFIPREKALLSRAGGRCPVDGVYLDFDPYEPHRHRCPICGRVYEGPLHDRFWMYWYQLWLAERSVHAAVLSALGVGDRYGSLARAILDGYAEQYLDYPNRDNVLGPSRLFFSTYLESIWLLQICIAADLLSFSGDRQTSGRVLERIVEPARELIAVYDEGGSNRQVWNDAALLASALLLDRNDDAEEALFGASGVAYHLSSGLLDDGTWYEGENYHLFAHRGLWYGVTLAEAAGVELPDPLLQRFQEGFATPFAAALPDFTLPARRDSQYGISLRQWRFAELCELGLARSDDERLCGALFRLYEDDVPRRDTGRARSSADVERNLPPTRLTRADLGWRSLLCARPALPRLSAVAPRSTLLAAQGLAIFRGDAGRVYVALDYGHSGGGHGHPDRLDLLLARDDVHWLDDMGTGSYVDPSLHWYRSTLAHNAPLFDGRSQQRVHGELVAIDESEHAGWVTAEAVDIGPGASAERTLVVMQDYVIDELAWQADRGVTIDLPIHLDARVPQLDGRMEPAPLPGGAGAEDGFGFVHDSMRTNVAAGECLRLEAQSRQERLRGWAESNRAVEWWRVVAPGPPAAGDRAFWMVRANGKQGTHRFVYAWGDAVAEVQFDGDSIDVRHADGTHHVHSRQEEGWRVVVRGGAGAAAHASERVIELGGLQAREFDDADRGAADDMTEIHTRTYVGSEPNPYINSYESLLTGAPLRRGRPFHTILGAPHYRRSEQTWNEADRPTADLSLDWTGADLLVVADVHLGGRPLTFAPAAAENPYDNEHPDINGDGVQLFLRTPDDATGWMLIPDRETAIVRTRHIDGWPGDRSLAASWSRTDDGYQIRVSIPLGDLPDAPDGRRAIALDVVVNEMPPGRERRRGQLVLSGGEGEFVYLRGDRHDPDRLLVFPLLDA